MTPEEKADQTDSKKRIVELFRDHVSSGKAEFFKKYGMDFVMGRREGPFLWDMDGRKRVFNLHCNGGVFNLGHRSSELINVLKESLEEIDIGNHHLISRERAELAFLISQLMPGDLDYTIFGVGGGEAVDLAFKIARAFTGKPKIISARGGYHGHTGLAMAAGDEKYRSPFGPSASGFVQVPFGDPDALFAAAGKDTAAVILETVPATLGIVIPPDGYLESIREFCTGHNIILIMDEVQTGLGRTGRLWGFEHFGIIPDIVVLGKGLSGGIYPISATVIRKPLESVFHADPFIHISTFGGSEIGCRVARRVLQISSDPAFLSHVKSLSLKFEAGVGMLMKKHPEYLTGFRQLGLMMGLKLANEISGPVLTKAAYDNDLLMLYANNDTSVCQFLPPLVMKEEQADWVIDRLDKALYAAESMRSFFDARRTKMNIDSDLLNKFEAGLDPQNLNDSSVPAVILGFGEISTVFQIGECADIAYKRMPLFKDIAPAERYSEQFLEYCNLLVESGLKLPESTTGIVALPGRPVVLYIAQKILPPERFAHKLIHVLNPDETAKMMEKILSRIELVWSFNRQKKPLFELALDGQLSNWVFPENGKEELFFVDTSTPLYRKNGVEQLDPELLLQSAPGFLRWMLRLFFLDDVMNRYYDRRQVCIDLAANLYKEQKPELLLLTVEIMNSMFFGKEKPLSAGEIEKYYRTDRMIWALFLAFRRIDRFIKTKILMKRYEFILPGKIKR